ncbi:MAG TPA: cytochrome P450 [Kofleriaceae bacterium]|nr:cytochrome P450 [Kofleriaceae bacterium]
MKLTDLVTPERLADPYPLYAQLRAMDPVLWMPGAFGVGAWMVTSHAICSQLLRSKQFGKEGERVVAPEVLARIPQQASDLVERRRHSLLFRDPPAHTRLRALVNLAFTPRTVERLRPHIAAIADDLVARAPARFDLVRDVAFPLPIIVISELLGVPAEDRDRFKAWSTVMTRGLEPDATADELAQAAAAVDGVDGYIAGVIDERRGAPRADLISELTRAHEADDALSKEELLATCRLILTAGHETTVNLIGNGALALLRHPQARGPITANTVEELLRFDSPVQLTLRFAFEDTTLGGHAVKTGDLVFMLLGAGNRDPAVFAEPDRLEPARANADKHLAFGAGIHYCLGASLARLEGQLALEALFRRRPDLALDGEPSWRRNLVLRGLATLPVA